MKKMVIVSLFLSMILITADIDVREHFLSGT